eukprot:UN26458
MKIKFNKPTDLMDILQEATSISNEKYKTCIELWKNEPIHNKEVLCHHAILSVGGVHHGGTGLIINLLTALLDGSQPTDTGKPQDEGFYLSDVWQYGDDKVV